MHSLPDHSLTQVLSNIHQVNDSSSNQPPRILMLYGSLRAESISKKLTMEAKRILEHFGAEVIVFDPVGLPVFDPQQKHHPKVQELIQAVQWSEGMVWCSPEIHGTLSAVFKNQIDWIPLSIGSIRPTQGRTLAVMQVSGGSQSFNAVNALRVLGRWMRLFTIPNQSSVPKAVEEFHENGDMKTSPYRDRVIDVMEELFRMTLLLRDHKEWLTSRYSEQPKIDKETPCLPERQMKQPSVQCC